MLTPFAGHFGVTGNLCRHVPELGDGDVDPWSEEEEALIRSRAVEVRPIIVYLAHTRPCPQSRM